ncbi:MAG: hypothetical protein C0403_05500 [Desulfobacterium sp.]|nr:hypothetical protein [Desulfobacterium sp.]
MQTYRLALHEIKQRIQTTQTLAILAANYELLSLYWYIGHKIVSLQQAQGWGGAVVEQIAADLQAEHLAIQGFSRTSLFAIRQFYIFFSSRFEVVPQPVGQLMISSPEKIIHKTDSLIKNIAHAIQYPAHLFCATILLKFKYHHYPHCHRSAYG